jgi:hypothetical protein
MWEFASTHTLAFLVALCIAISPFYALGQALSLMYNRRCRSKNIVAQGWPPAHCDADGDPIQELRWNE